MLGKFAVVQRSLLPELLTAATQPDSSSRSRAALYTPHRTGRREILYYDVVMLSAMLQCLAIWKLQSIAVLVVCCKARGWGGVQAGWGQHSRLVWRQCSAAIGCCRTVQSAPAPPPVHLSTAARTQQQPSSRTANSLQIWVSDRRTAPQPRTPRRAETLQSCSAQRDLGRVPPHTTTQRHGGFLRQVAVARDTA